MIRSLWQIPPPTNDRSLEITLPKGDASPNVVFVNGLQGGAPKTAVEIRGLPRPANMVEGKPGPPPAKKEGIPWLAMVQGAVLGLLLGAGLTAAAWYWRSRQKQEGGIASTQTVHAAGQGFDPSKVADDAAGATTTQDQAREVAECVFKTGQDYLKIKNLGNNGKLNEIQTRLMGEPGFIDTLASALGRKQLGLVGGSGGSAANGASVSPSNLQSAMVTTPAPPATVTIANLSELTTISKAVGVVDGQAPEKSIPQRLTDLPKLVADEMVAREQLKDLPKRVVDELIDRQGKHREEVERLKTEMQNTEERATRLRNQLESNNGLLKEALENRRAMVDQLTFSSSFADEVLFNEHTRLAKRFMDKVVQAEGGHRELVQRLKTALALPAESESDLVAAVQDVYSQLSELLSALDVSQPATLQAFDAALVRIGNWKDSEAQLKALKRAVRELPGEPADLVGIGDAAVADAIRSLRESLESLEAVKRELASVGASLGVSPDESLQPGVLKSRVESIGELRDRLAQVKRQMGRLNDLYLAMDAQRDQRGLSQTVPVSILLLQLYSLLMLAQPDSTGGSPAARAALGNLSTILGLADHLARSPERATFDQAWAEGEGLSWGDAQDAPQWLRKYVADVQSVYHGRFPFNAKANSDGLVVRL
ncbi:hypothetical protein [Fimbriimonas ginsengisoli]|uniref:hypothetical protein n=1 Tax=Fimbriimonas ginsengisoli TaxID=1005039 RepID=UPI0011860FB1|nr:hypothetical protein [Fimbriimonas ginsengisoli]